jgi:hypothetical protein
MSSTESHFSEAELPMEDMGLDLDSWLVGLPGGLFESDTVSSDRLEVHVSQIRTHQLQEIGQNGEVTSQEKSCGLQSLACLQYRRLILHITIRLLALSCMLDHVPNPLEGLFLDVNRSEVPSNIVTNTQCLGVTAVDWGFRYDSQLLVAAICQCKFSCFCRPHFSAKGLPGVHQVPILTMETFE